jgi:hypothetical protein
MNLKYKLLRFLGYKTYDEMFKELHSGKRKTISYADGQKAIALERASFPKNIRYPKPGETYICISDAQIRYMTHWMSPYTGGAKAVFPKDESIKITDFTQSKPTSVYCQANNFDKIEKLIVPQVDRSSSKYNGYSLIIDTIILNKNFRLIESIKNNL